MKYFEKLIIENFQSHQYTVIDFSEGLNVFAGPSDSGKSAILRAIRWVLFNVPRGLDFIRVGSKECKVTLIFSDGTYITRLRSSTINRYLIYDGVKEQIFEGFGTDVPEEVLNIHQLKPIVLDKKEHFLNFSMQLEAPFFISETSFVKAKFIGKICGSYIIDKAIKNTYLESKRLNQQIKQLEYEQQELEEKLKPYSNIDELEKKVKETEEKLEKINSMENLKKSLILLKDNLEKTKEEKERLRQKKDKYKNIPFVFQKILLIEEKVLLVKNFQNIHLKLKNNILQQNSLEKFISKNKYLVTFDLKIEKLTNLAKLLQTLTTISVKLRKCALEKKNVIGILEKKENISLASKHLVSIETKLSLYKKKIELLKEYKDVTLRVKKGCLFKKEKEKEIAALAEKCVLILKRFKKCPTCGLEMTNKTFEKILKEYKGESYAFGGKY